MLVSGRVYRFCSKVIIQTQMGEFGRVEGLYLPSLFVNKDLYPRKLTFWTPKMQVWKMIFLFKGVIFRCYVSVLGEYLEDHPMTCKWLITMLHKSPEWLINGGDPNHILTGIMLQVHVHKQMYHCHLKVNTQSCYFRLEKQEKNSQVQTSKNMHGLVITLYDLS